MRVALLKLACYAVHGYGSKYSYHNNNDNNNNNSSNNNHNNDNNTNINDNKNNTDNNNDDPTTTANSVENIIMIPFPLLKWCDILLLTPSIPCI